MIARPRSNLGADVRARAGPRPAGGPLSRRGQSLLPRAAGDRAAAQIRVARAGALLAGALLTGSLLAAGVPRAHGAPAHGPPAGGLRAGGGDSGIPAAVLGPNAVPAVAATAAAPLAYRGDDALLYTLRDRGADCVLLVDPGESAPARSIDLPPGDVGVDVVLAAPDATVGVVPLEGADAQACVLRRHDLAGRGLAAADVSLLGLLTALGAAHARLDWAGAAEVADRLESHLFGPTPVTPAVGGQPPAARAGPWATLACVSLARVRQTQGLSGRARAIIERCAPTEELSIELARLNQTSELLQEAGDFEAAARLLQKATDTVAEAGTAEEHTLLQSRLGFVLAVTGRVEEAAPQLDASLARARALNQPHLIGEAANNMASLHFLQGDFATALARLEEAYDALLRARRPLARMEVINNLGLIYTRSGNFERALAVLQDGLDLLRHSPDQRDEGMLYSQLGYTYLVLGDTRRAAAHLWRSVRIYDRSDERWRAAMIRRHLGTAQRELGQAEEALETHLASLPEVKGAGFEREHAHLLNELARDALVLGKLTRAEAWIEEAVAMRAAVPDPRVRAESLGLQARLLRRRGDTARARASLLAAQNEFSRLDYAPARLELQMALFALERDAGHLDRAIAYGMAAMAVAEELGAVLETERLGPAWARRTHESFNAVALAMLDEARRTDSPALVIEALNLLERSRAAFTGRRRTLSVDMTEQAARTLERRRQEVALASLRRISEPASAELDAAYYRTYERYRAAVRLLTREALVDAAPARDVTESFAALAPGATVLYYVLGRENGYVVVADRNGVRETVPVPGVETARQQVTALRRAIQLERRRRPVEALTLAAHFLHPALPHVNGERVLLVADGPLHMAPMAALPIAANTPAPLASRVSLVYVPALHLYDPGRSVAAVPTPARAPATVARAAQEVTAAGAASASSAPEVAAGGADAERLDVVVLADPSFRGLAGTAAAAAVGSTGAGEGGTGGAKISAQGAEGAPFEDQQRNWRSELEQLPWSAKEAAEIVALIESNHVFLGREATRDALFGPLTRRARIVHIATHGYFRESIPDIVGIALAPTAHDDGFVTLTDLFGTRLRAELVVISGCETGLGEAVGGEGLNSLARGFLSQGVGATLSTLWSVSDAASAIFMRYFYQELIRLGEPAAALREAQRRMRRDRRWESPFYWAGYVLHGTGAPLTLSAR